jgi:hypothetical protein
LSIFLTTHLFYLSSFSPISQVKLDPSLADAWVCLGHSFWKKGDLSQAKNCFKAALKKGPHKEALRQLSMLERSLAKGKDLYIICKLTFVSAGVAAGQNRSISSS